MKILSRAEAGLAPPVGPVPSGIKKKYIIIHHTASANGILSPDAERDLMRMWQTMHEQKYGAVDILQGFSVFQSGRIYENRMPWDSNNGAIYNAGGGQWDGVGIECQGNFHGSVLMADMQYQSLLYLCITLVQKLNIPLDGPVVLGHQQLHPCRPGDPKSTDCPANLLGQLLTSGKLKADILKGLSTETGEEIELSVHIDKLNEGDISVYPCHVKSGQFLWVDVINWPKTVKSKVDIDFAQEGGGYGNLYLKHKLPKETTSIRFNFGEIHPNWGDSYIRVRCAEGKVQVKYVE